MLLALILVVLCVAFGCQGPPSTGGADSGPKTEEPADAARVVCGNDGVRVLTPRVESGPDGVHLEIDNRLDGSTDLSVSHPGGGMGWSVPTGRSERVANVPPGKVKIDCYGLSWREDRLLAMEIATVQVLSGDSGYKSTKLDCPRGKSGKIKPFTKEETQEQQGTPVEIFRRSNVDSLKEGDTVEIAGNTRSPHEKTVRVVRDGRVIAKAHYLEFSTGWMEATDESCAEF